MRLTVSFWECLCLLILTVVALPGAVLGATNDVANAAVRYHCAGSAQLTGNSNLVTFNKAFALRPAAAVQKLALERISGLLAGGLNFGTNAALLLEPLLSDVLKSESMGSFGGTTTNPLNFVLALRLDATQAQLWHDNLDKAFGEPGKKFAAGEFNGWRWDKSASDSIWIVPAGGWLLAGRGDEFLPLQTEYLQQVKRQGRPAPPLQDNWLEADMDWTRPTVCAPDWARFLKPARLKISIAAEQDNLRITARVIYPEAIPWKSAPWQIPTELIDSPLVSFTAGQDVAAYLNPSPAFSRLDGDPLTNQFCAWAQNSFPFLTYMAWPEADATNVLEQLSTEASDVFSPELKQFNGTELVWLAKQRKLVLANLRVILPSLQAVREKAGEYLLLGLFPLAPGKKTAPDELLEKINGRTNLVYYDWELTGPRLQHWQMLGLMLLTRLREPTDYILDARRLEDKWLYALARLAGNATTTEITRASPNELAVVRNTPLGFTGIEMFLMANWLSTAGSPPINPRPPAH
jgi:hypothetical protein